MHRGKVPEGTCECDVVLIPGLVNCVRVGLIRKLCSISSLVGREETCNFFILPNLAFGNSVHKQIFINSDCILCA